ncbi:MAG: glycosyl transferase family 2, partial [Prevotellaceae bacterium]|nr:glycosyl transferase family 2 [Prevotellaceae bacterium]
RRHEAKLGQHVRLLKMLDRLRRYHALWLLKGVGSILRRPLRRNLCSTHPCVRLFNLYKLLYYVSL